MYAVSDEFLEAVQENTRSYYWAGTITTTAGKVYSFDYSDIVKGSGYISSQCCGSTEIELGTVYSSELGITLYSEVDRYTLEDAIIEISCFLLLPNESYEEVPMGVFEVSEANRTVNCLEIKAYDYMLRFEKDFNGFQSTGTAYDFIYLCCLACSVEMAQTQEEIESMANGSETLSIYSEDDIETYRDVLYYVGQVLGGFFVINREGKLELRKYGSEPVQEIEQKHRFSSSFSDFITRYTAVSSTNMRTETSEYYSVDPDDGLTMNLGVNPLLQFGLDETRAELCTNILNDLQAVNYVPFDSDTIGNPALDLGDVLTFSGGQADENQISCITSIKYTIGGKQKLKCVGKNPKLSQAKSKNDKNIAGLLSQIEEGAMGIYTYTNASAYTVGDSNTKIISMEFTAKEETYAQFIAQVVLEVAADSVEMSATATGTITIPDSVADSSGDTSSNESTEDETTDDSSEDTDSSSGTEISVSLPVTWTEDGEALVYVTYEYNNSYITAFAPVETWHSGKHILTLYYPIENIAASVASYFNVYLRLEGGTGKVATGDCIAAIFGQSMGGTYAWDGILELTEENIGRFSLVTGIANPGYSDDMSYEKYGQKDWDVSETVTAAAFGRMFAAFEEDET
ncbi:MAG: hypothetical protein LUD18_03015 [Lachnospiraceae bacterium]|nr:hypothetical protein [Lachnospiraceae bacterium]